MGSPAVTMAVYAALVYDVISATNSSPQTTEINAAKRADTLMKWVHVGLAQAAIFAVLGIALEARSGNAVWPPALGAGMAGGMLYVQYVHAKNKGINSPGPSTEEY
jgi:uncharacterized membrane protein